MQRDFIDYVRKQTRSYAKVLIPIIFGAAVIAFVAFLVSDPEKTGKQEMLQTSLLLGPPSLLAGVLLVLSYKKIAFVELLTPAMITGLPVMMVTVNMT